MSNLRKTSQNILRGFLFFSVSLIFFSCAALPSSDPARTQAESFAEVEAVFPQWQPYKKGIDFFHGKIVIPKIEFWALRIDLAAPDLKIITSGGAGGAADGTGRTLSARVSSFVGANGLTAGINAVPFDIVSSKEGRPINNIGIVISDGKQASPVYPYFDALVFYKDGKAAVVSQAAINSTENIVNAVGGFLQVLVDGKPAEWTLGVEIRHPRSAAGISANGEYLYLLVIDGRRLGSIGGTEKETALLLFAMGSWNGINFDGGGSSALVLRSADGRIRVVNTPIHGGIPGRERAVAGCLGIAAGGLK
jgi:Exopolysaccharide biosynthesis protein related to N-acetylglucosamine-1-phosphodiester alpha-N-acetylglucosaminidase